MSKGGWTKETKVISVRVPHTVYSIMKERAGSKGQTMSEYLTACIQYIEKHIPNEKKEV